MNKIDLPDLQTKSINRKRYYITPDGNEYPSVTTVLSGRGKEGLMAWRKKVGEDVANHICRKAADRGTKVHQMCEDWFNGLPESDPDAWKKHEKNFLPFCLFNRLKDDTFHNFGEIIVQEAPLYSDKYRLAGRVDCIAEYNGELSIIDFKTSTSERNDSYNENYYIQTTAYAEMFEELTGNPIDQIVILVVTEDGSVQEFIKSKTDYIPLLEETLSDWYGEEDDRRNSINA